MRRCGCLIGFNLVERQCYETPQYEYCKQA